MTPPVASVTRTDRGPGGRPHQLAQETTRSAAAGRPGGSTAGLRDRFAARTSRTDSDLPSARTIATWGRPRRTQGPGPTLVNSMSPWAPSFSPCRPALIRSTALAHRTVPETVADVGRVGCFVAGGGAVLRAWETGWWLVHP